jgi:hypothetical protein
LVVKDVVGRAEADSVLNRNVAGTVGPGLILFALVILLFPDGSLPSRSARGIIWAFVAGLVLFTGALAAAVAQAIVGHHLGLDSYDGLVVIDRARGPFGQKTREHWARRDSSLALYFSPYPP